MPPLAGLRMLRFIAAILMLLAGTVAYWLFHPEILLFQLLQLQNPAPLPGAGVIALFMRNHFADLVWCAAAFMIAGQFRNLGFPRFYGAILLALPFVSELLQASGSIPGTFDWIDLGIYTVLLGLFFTKGDMGMNALMRHLVGIITVVIFAGAVIGSATTPTYVQRDIMCEAKEDEIFTKPALSDILQSSENLAVVLRVPTPGKEVAEETRRSQNLLYSTIDKELAKAGFKVRDRALFGKVLDQQSLDYSKIGVLTETDLIVELVYFRSDAVYKVSKLQDKNGAWKEPPFPITVKWPAVEFNIFSVKQNDLIGSFTFYTQPCLNGCSIEYSETAKRVRGNIPYDTDDVYKDFARRLIVQLK